MTSLFSYEHYHTLFVFFIIDNKFIINTDWSKSLIMDMEIVDRFVDRSVFALFFVAFFAIFYLAKLVCCVFGLSLLSIFFLV